MIMLMRLNGFFLLLLLALGYLAGCGNEYRCPDPIGPIVRDDCDDYKTRYESLKLQLGVSFGGVGVSVGASQSHLRDPSELLQLLMQQTMGLCKDFNACRLMPDDYRRRRELSERKFTAITAIAQQLKNDLDAESKKQLIAKLLQILTGEEPAPQERPKEKVAERKITAGFFRNETGVWVGSKFSPPRSTMAAGVPTIVDYELTVAKGFGHPTSYIHFQLWGKIEADDYLIVKLDNPALEGKDAPHTIGAKSEERGRASIKFDDVLLKATGQMHIYYRVGATGIKHDLGTVPLSPESWLGRGYLAYQADPIHRDPIEYERPWIVVYSRLDDKTRVALRCEHNGQPIVGVITGSASSGTYRADHLRRHHLPLPIRLPLQGGQERMAWKPSFPNEKVPQDLFPAEAAGRWNCRITFNGQIARRVTFTLRADGRLESKDKMQQISPPWWPLPTEKIANEAETAREEKLAQDKN